jgi:hypothetical protein
MNHSHLVRPRRSFLALSMLGVALTQSGTSLAQSAAPSVDPASTHVILRMQVGGGFVPMTVNLLEVPTFTLYEDGTAIFRPASDAPYDTPPALVQARLSDAQVDALLTYALGPGGLAAAAEKYDQMFVSDAPTTVFTVDVPELTKTVSVYALGFDLPPGDPNADILGQLESLAQLLGDFGKQVQAGNVESAALYEPLSYLATFTPDYGGSTATPAPWPFPDVPVPQVPADGSSNPTVVLSADQVAQVTTVPSGGVGDLYYEDASGQRFFVTIRPMLPDEPLPVDIS